MKIKGQAAIELLIIVGAMLFFFVVFLFAIQGNITGKTVENNNRIVQETAFFLVDEINLADSSTDGYERTFTLPEKIINMDYEISILDDSVFIITDDEKYALAFPVVGVTGQPQKGENMIRKEEGVIYLNVVE